MTIRSHEPERGRDEPCRASLIAPAALDASVDSGPSARNKLCKLSDGTLEPRLRRIRMRQMFNARSSRQVSFLSAWVLVSTTALAGGARPLTHSAASAPQSGSEAPVSQPALIPWPTSVTLWGRQGLSDHQGHAHRGHARPTGPAPNRRVPGRARSAGARGEPGGSRRGSLTVSGSHPVRADRRRTRRRRRLRGDRCQRRSRSPPAPRPAPSTASRRCASCCPGPSRTRGPRPFAVSLPAAQITDRPRFSWRGAFLDVSRHFFSPLEVRRYIDLVAMYRINRLHLHLSDDQGWRIQIDTWPNLTTHGGSTEVKGGPAASTPSRITPR